MKTIFIIRNRARAVFSIYESKTLADEECARLNRLVTELGDSYSVDEFPITDSV